MHKNKTLYTMEDVLAQLKYIRTKKQEYVVCLALDSRSRVIARRTVTIGLLDLSIAHPREVFAPPLKDRASSIIVAHNHPSGIATPSKQDISTTQQLVAAGQLLGLRLQDHIIVTRNDYYSFRDKGMI